MVRWTPEEEHRLEKLYGTVINSILIDKFPGRSTKSLAMKAANMGLRSPVNGQNGRARRDLKFKKLREQISGSEIDELWDTIVDFQEAQRNLENRVDKETIMIGGDEPVAIGFLADAHIGTITCKYSELLERVEKIASTDRFYLFSVGDTHDNQLPQHHGEGTFEQIVPPRMQKKLVEDLYTKMKGQWLGLVQGCHEEWSWKYDQFDWTEYLAAKMECPNFGHGGTATLNLGAQTYVAMIRHKYRFGSSFNLTHTVKRMREQLGDFDIGCVAHHHQAVIEQVACGDNKTRIFVRPGSFKAPGRFAQQLGYHDAGAFIPAVVIYPDKKRMVPFLHFEDAIDFLEVAS